MNTPPVRQPDFPAPPHPKDVFAFLKWLFAFWKTNRRLRSSHSQDTGKGRDDRESFKTVVIATSTDLMMLIAKAFAAASTGSVALFAETLHSLADTGNQLFLLNGLRRGGMQSDLRHPFGYGAEVFFWSLLAAIGIFAIGGVLAIWEGVQRLIHPSEIQSSLLAYAVLTVGCLFDGISWLISVRQLRRDANQRGVSLKQHVRSTTDTAVTAVYYEDSVAILGNVIALAGLGLHQAFGLAAPDAVAGIAVGILLSVVGIQLAGRNRDLLTNRSESPVILDRIRNLLAANPEVTAVGKVISVFVGPHKLLVIAEVQPADSLSGIHLRQLLANLRDSVAQAIQRSAIVFLMPVVAAEKQPELTPWDHEYWLRLFPDDEQV